MADNTSNNNVSNASVFFNASNIKAIQFGIDGAFLIMFTNISNHQDLLIGKRIEIDFDFDFSKIVLDNEENRNRLTLKGTWYIYRRYPLLDQKTKKVVGHKITLIRGSKKLCMPCDGEPLNLRMVSEKYGFPDIYKASGSVSSSELVERTIMTTPKYTSCYKSLVNISLAMADDFRVPIFWPDGSLTYENILKNWLSSPEFQERLSAMPVPLYGNFILSAEKTNRINTWLQRNIAEVFLTTPYAAGIVLELPAGFIYEVENSFEENERIEYFFIDNLYIINGNTVRYKHYISRITVPAIDARNLKRSVDELISAMSNMVKSFIKKRLRGE